MMNRQGRGFFGGSATPATCLSGAALLIMASDRLAHAIIAAGALAWVYSLSLLSAHVGKGIFPKQGRQILFAFLTSFFAGLYLLLIWLLSPLCALESFFVISIIPLFCMASGLFKQLETLSLEETVYAAFSEALVLGSLVAVFAIIREPIGFLTLSLPGGARGIVLLFSFKTESFLPVRLIASSCGALLLLGYFLQMYRSFRANNMPREDIDDR